MAFEVITYGNGELFREIFNAVATLCGGDKDYMRLIHMSVLMGGMWAAFIGIVKRDVMANAKIMPIYCCKF